ncbi:MAG: LTA synthase family protein [Desulfitobacteriia bacterium]
MVKACLGFVKKLRNRKRKDLSRGGFIKYLLLSSVFFVFLNEIIQRASLTQVLSWIGKNPLIPVLNIFLAVLVILFFLLLTGSLTSSLLLSFYILVFFATTHRVKKQLLGEPLFPWDFCRADQVINLLPQYRAEFTFILLGLGLFFIISFLGCRFFLPRYRITWRSRVLILIVLVVLLPGTIYYRHTPVEEILKKANIENIFWQQSANSLTNGFLLGFAMNLENLMVFEPPGYKEEAIAKISEKYSLAKAVFSSLDSKEKTKPNLVIVLNEAFWDPTLLPNIQFSKDPLPFFRQQSAEHISGIIVSPVFGGSTANVEFELLTGLSTSFLPQGTIAYQRYIERPLPALPNLLKAEGYSTIAIHPYEDWFYNRNLVYPLLGFDSFYHLDDFKLAVKKGEYVADIEVSKKIIEELQSSSQPAFIFALTMQNHGPYSKNRYEEREITVEGPVSDEGKDILETYVQGVKDADRSLEYLIDFLSTWEEPTIVFFAGDHLPYLGKDYKVYRETGFIQGFENEWSLEEKLKMKSVPLLIWSNYEDFSAADIGPFSFSFLGPYLLEKSGLQPNFLFNFGKNFASNYPVFVQNLVLDKDKNFVNLSSKELEAFKKEYWLLEYDLLFGEQYYFQYD